MGILYFISDRIESFLRNDFYYQQFQRNFSSNNVIETSFKEIITNPISLDIIIFLFLIIQIIITKNKIELNTKKISIFINFFYSLNSLLFCLFTIYIVYLSNIWTSVESLWQANLVLNPYKNEFETILYIYYLSKIWEYIDIILVSLNGLPIHIHFRVHHNTTIILAWFIYQYKSASGLTFLILNTWLHFFVYLYHSQLFMNDLIWFMCRFFGYFQLIIGMICTINVIFINEKKNDFFSEVIQLILYVLYFILFQYEIFGDKSNKKIKKIKKKKG